MANKIIATEILHGILRSFPGNMRFCFAYGSGAFKQLNNTSVDNMLDFIFVVNNPTKWHDENLKRNPTHYTIPFRLLGKNSITRYQDQYGARVYFNSLIEVAGHIIKYGVISEDALIEDLLEWRYIYVAGRLHKPVKKLVEPPERSQLADALVQNLHSAVHAALLLLPEHFTETEFYTTIAGLSYNGDFRMVFGENKNKVNNIVLSQLEDFKLLYSPILKHFESYVDFPKSGEIAVCNQDTSSETKMHHLLHLPRYPLLRLIKIWKRGPRGTDTVDHLHSIAYDRECGAMLGRSLKETVWASSLTQSVKGINTAGYINTLKYSAMKISKMLAAS